MGVVHTFPQPAQGPLALKHTSATGEAITGLGARFCSSDGHEIVLVTRNAEAMQRAIIDLGMKVILANTAPVLVFAGEDENG